MKWNLIKGNWKQLIANYINPLDIYPDDQVGVIAGKRDHFAGKIQDAYAVTKERVDNQLT